MKLSLDASAYPLVDILAGPDDSLIERRRALG